jgi:SAM-dependent methyltransferase
LVEAENRAEIARRILLPEFPRSAAYDPQWQFENSLGASLWSAELLSQSMELKPGMRVLDVGCGRAASSIFLAREFGVSVVAVDRTPSPSENWARIVEAGCADRVMPVQGDARDLNFAHDYFDAIVGIGSFQEFGTDNTYIWYLMRFLRPGGQIGIIVPAMTTELNGRVPEGFRSWWSPDYHAFHTPEWWRRHFVNSGLADVSMVEMVPEGWRYWLVWEQLVAEFGPLDERKWYAAMTEGLIQDAGRYLGLARLVATRLARTTCTFVADADADGRVVSA